LFRDLFYLWASQQLWFVVLLAENLSSCVAEGSFFLGQKEFAVGAAQGCSGIAAREMTIFEYISIDTNGVCRLASSAARSIMGLIPKLGGVSH
jgi:hypothetical protein